MGTRSGDTKPGDAAGAAGRRDFLRKAAIAGTGAFAVPMIVTVDPADAQALTSPPPEPPASSKSPKLPGGGLASNPGAGGGAQESATGGTPVSGRTVSERTELPRTGANLDRLVAAGLAATAGGAALVLWSAEAKAAGAKSAETPTET